MSTEVAMEFEEDSKDIMRPLKGMVRRPMFGVVDLESKEATATTNRHLVEEYDLIYLDHPNPPPRPTPIEGYSTKGGFERPFLVGYYDGLEFISFNGDDCLKAMLLYLLSPKLDGMTYYAHNGGGFDWLHFLPYLEACGYYFEIMTVQSKIQCMRVKPHKNSKKKGWTFLDSYQLIPAKLEDITKTFNTEVKKGKLDYDTAENDPAWLEYLKDDCISLYQTLMSFYELVEEKLKGEVGMTTAATSMKTYRRSYQSHPIERHSKHHDFFRKAYYGGRVEIFRESIEGAKYYDINSSYPFAMLSPMPQGKLIEWKGTPPKWLLDGEYIGFAEANVIVPQDTFIPVLPYRADDGKLIFPVGKFSGVWTVIELLEAEKQGATIQWLDSKWIKQGYIFNDFIESLFEYRDKDKKNYDESLSYISKIMMNSLYGKFATNTLRDKIIVVSKNDEAPDGAALFDPESLFSESDESSIYIVQEEISAPYIIPQISAYITAIARLNLHKFMLNSESSKDKLAYCDTDAIITTANMECSSKLGGLKDEGKGLVYSGIFLQPKLYYLEGRSSKVELDIPKWATHISLTSGILYFKDSNNKIIKEVSKEGLTEIPKETVSIDISSSRITMYEYVQCKIVMKGYHKRTKKDFDAIRLGKSLSFDSLEKIGAMVRKGFKEGPKIKTIARCIKTEDRKRRHINGITYPIILDNDILDNSDLDEQ